MAFECLLDHSPLSAFPPPVDQTYLAEARFVCSLDVFLDHRCDIPGLEGVQIDGAFDRDMVGHVTHSSPGQQLAFNHGLVIYCGAS
jgi:hypothetical protein